MKKNQLILIIFAAFFLISVFLRLYQIAALTDWSGDSGGDLLVARNILFYGHRPLVGPFLTVDNIFLPPLYFYLLAGILWVVHTPFGVVVFFFIVNMFLGLLLGLLAGKMVDSIAGVIAFGLFAVSATLVEHGRSFYQPYLLEPFFFLSLYFLWTATHHRRPMHIVISVVCFSVAASIYPSPWLLAPYILYLLHRFLRIRLGERKTFKAVIGAAGLLVVGSTPIYIPWFVHEFQNGFPTLTAISKNDFGGISNLSVWPQLYATYLYQLLNQFFGIESVIFVPYSYYAAICIVTVLVFIGVLAWQSIRSLPRERAAIYTRAFSFVDIRWYIVSFVPMVFFWESAYHRLWVYLPILFLISALVIRLAFESRNTWLRVCVGVMVAFYSIGNTSANWRHITTFPKNSLGNTEHAALSILSDVEKRGVTNHDYQVLYYTPYGYGNYNLATILYFLQEYSGYPVNFLKNGNDIDRYSINTPHAEAVYLICRWDIPAGESTEKCSDVFVRQNPTYVLDIVTVLPLGRIFVYIKVH